MNETMPNAEDLKQLEQLAAKFPWLLSADPRRLRTVGEVIDAYVRDAPNEICPQQLEIRKRHLDHFRSEFGLRRCSELAGYIVKKWIDKHRRRYRSAWTRLSVKTSIVRVFSWAVENGMLGEHPIRGLRFQEPKGTGRVMTDDELRRSLRHADPALRRLLTALKLTGARPSELTKLRWEHIDWENAVARLVEHKSAKKTGRPRILIFPPAMMKLLAFLRRTRRLPMALELKQLLEGQPRRALPVRAVVAHFRSKGFVSYRALYRSRETIGAELKRIKGKVHYYLPPAAAASTKRRPWAKTTFDSERVFVCQKQTPWTRQTLQVAFFRARRRAGLDADCKLYGLRHRFVTNAVRAGVNLKVVATVVGHVDSRMVDKVYAHVQEDFKLLHEAAARATTGPPKAS